MNMMQMVGIMVALYVIALTALCIYRRAINIKIANGLFIAVDLIFYVAWTYASYLRGWTKGFMMLDNISPFIMTMIPVSLFLGERLRQYVKCATAFLWVGMLVALVISPQQAYILSDYTNATPEYTTEAACHLIASLYGVYLIISGQVKCDFRSWKRALICLYSAIGFGVIANYLFHSDNFGMNPYGDYSIYMIDIFGSFWATFAAYILGVLLVVTIGMQLGHLLTRLISLYNTDDYKESEPISESEKKEELVSSIDQA